MTRRFQQRRSVWALALFVGASTAMLAGDATAQTPAAAESRTYAIPAQPLATALTAFGQQSGLQVSADAGLVAGRGSPGVNGAFGPIEALSRLLTGSGLTFKASGDVVTLEPAPVVGGDAQRLGPVRVHGAGVSGGYTADPGRTENTRSYTPPAAVTAFKMPLTLRQTPQTVTVITNQVIRDFGLDQTRDILEFTPGVHVQSERSTEAYFFKARGFDMQTQFDGVPSPRPVGGRGNASPDSAVIDRIEVLHGAAGLLAGAGAPGGTVNIVRKTPTGAFQASLEGGLDSFGGYRFVGDVGGPIANGVGARLVAVHEERDLFIEHAKGKHNVLYGTVEAKLGERTTLTAGLSYEEIYDAAFGAIYGNPTQLDGTLLPIPRKLNLGATWANQNDQFYQGFLRLQHDFGGGWTLQAVVNRDTTNYKALESVPGNEPDVGFLELYSQREGWENRSTSLDLFAQGPVKLFGRSHDLMVGFNGAKTRYDYDPYVYGIGAVAQINLATWDPRRGGDPASIPYGSDWWGYGASRQYGGFAAGRFELLDNLHVILGSRVSWTRESSMGVTYQKNNSEFTPYAGAVWDIDKHFSAYASYSEIFQPHGFSVIDSSGNVLDPVLGENYEAGLKLELFEGDFNAALAVFRLNQTNLAEDDPTGVLPGRCGGLLDPCQRATGLVRSQGFEVSASGKIAEGWQVMTGYAYLNQKHKTGASAGQRYDTLTPKHTFNGAVSYTAPNDKWSAGASAKYQSATFTAGTLEDMLGNLYPYRISQDSYVILGVFGRYNVTETLSVRVAVENLLDKKYLNGISWPVHGNVYGDPRQATVTVRKTF